MKDDIDLKDSQQWLDAHLEKIREAVIDDAVKRSGDGEPSPEDVAISAMKIAPSERMALEATKPRGISLPFGFIFRSLPPIAWVSALLAIVFGGLGLYADPSSQQGWLDIAKIFAGAVVGAAGTSRINREKVIEAEIID